MAYQHGENTIDYVIDAENSIYQITSDELLYSKSQGVDFNDRIMDGTIHGTIPIDSLDNHLLEMSLDGVYLYLVNVHGKISLIGEIGA